MYFPFFSDNENKKSSAFTAEDKKFLWYHLSLSPKRGPHGILTDPQAVPGHTRLPLLAFFQGSHSERNSTPRFSLPCTNRQFSEKNERVCTGFHHRVLYIIEYCLVYHFSLFKSIHIFYNNLDPQKIFHLNFKSKEYNFPILFSF